MAQKPINQIIIEQKQFEDLRQVLVKVYNAANAGCFYDKTLTEVKDRLKNIQKTIHEALK